MILKAIEVPIAFVAAMGSKKATKVCGLINRVRKWECNLYSRVNRIEATYAELERRLVVDVSVYTIGGTLMIWFFLECCKAFFR